MPYEHLLPEAAARAGTSASTSRFRARWRAEQPDAGFQWENE